MAIGGADKDVGSHQEAQATALCVAWTPPGDRLDPSLQNALMRPGLDVVLCDDAFSAAACLCAKLGDPGPSRILLLIEPSKLSRLLEVLDAAPKFVRGLAVWLFDPTQRPVLRSLTLEQAKLELTKQDAAKRAKEVGTQDSGNKVSGTPQPAPSAAPAATLPAARPVPQAQPKPATNPKPISAPHAGAPNLKLSGEGKLPQTETPATPNASDINSFAGPQGDNPKARGRVLSDEELAMLLGDDPPGTR